MSIFQQEVIYIDNNGFKRDAKASYFWNDLVINLDVYLQGELAYSITEVEFSSFPGQSNTWTYI